VTLADTDVIVGIKAEVGKVHPNFPDEGIIQLEVECSTSVSASFEGRGGEEMASNLKRMLSLLLSRHGSPLYQQLCIIPNQLCWILHIDCLIVQSQGNLLDCLSFAIRAALQHTTLPKVNATELLPEEEDVQVGEETFMDMNTQYELELEGDGDPESVMHLDISQFPIVISFGISEGSSIYVDATLREEACTGARLSIAINEAAHVCSIEKFGTSIRPDMVVSCLTFAKSIAKEKLDRLNEAVSREQKKQRELHMVPVFS